MLISLALSCDDGYGPLHIFMPMAFECPLGLVADCSEDANSQNNLSSLEPVKK